MRGHVATTCTAPCFSCGGNHRYFECSDPELHHAAKRMANRNRVTWTGYGAGDKKAKKKGGMKESGCGRFWVRKEYDPEYTPKRDVSPQKACIQAKPHVSDRCRTSGRVLTDQEEAQAMTTLIDGGFLTDACLDKFGNEVACKGTLNVQYYCSEDRHNRKIYCVGVPEKERHRLHWLAGWLARFSQYRV